MTPSTSRASSPNIEVRKRGRLARGAKLNKYPELRHKQKFSPPSKVNSRLQQQKQQQLLQQAQQQQQQQLVRPSRKTFSAIADVDDVDDDDDDDGDSDESVTSNDFSDSESENEAVLEPPPERSIRLTSNPEYWSPMDTARFFAQTTDCRHLAHLMVDEAIDGQALMLLTYPTIKDHWQLKASTAVQLCQHIESVRLAHISQF